MDFEQLTATVSSAVKQESQVAKEILAPKAELEVVEARASWLRSF